MFKQFYSLLWLRCKIILFNKVILLQILMPIGLAYLYKFMIDNQSESKEQLTIPYLMICLSLSFALAIGGPVLTVIAEEKEKNNLKMLLLSGISFFKYLLSTVVFPIIISAFYVIILPIILGVQIENVTNYTLVCVLTVIVILLLYLLLGLLAKSQVMAQTFAIPTMLVSAFLPMLSNMNKTISKIVDYSYMGFFTKFFTKWKDFLWNHSVVQLISILIWISCLLFFVTVVAKKQK